MKNVISRVAEIKLSYAPRVPVRDRPYIKCSEDAYKQFIDILNPTDLCIKEEYNTPAIADQRIS